MKIQEQDRFHGPALMQIVEHDSFKALNKASETYGHYVINTDRQVFVKYATNESAPWQFTYAPNELSSIRGWMTSDKKTYFCLVCGGLTICCLTEQEWDAVVDRFSAEAQWIKVSVPPGGSCHVAGRRASLKRTVPHISFPNKVFEGLARPTAPRPSSNVVSLR